MKTQLIDSGVYHIQWILSDKDKVIGAMHGDVYMDMEDIKNESHVDKLYRRYIKREAKHEKRSSSGKSRSKLCHK